MRVLLFEDQGALNLSPLTLLRPVFELRCGHFTLRERLQAWLRPEAWGGCVRPELQETYAESHPGAHINDLKWLAADSTLVVNGRWLPTRAAVADIRSGEAGWCNGELVYASLHAGSSHSSNATAPWEEIAKTLKPVQISDPLLAYPWDLIARNPKALHEDFGSRTERSSAQSLPQQVAVVGSTSDVFVHATARIDPFVVLDATQGPIWIDADARIQAFTRIEGPAFIGQGSQLFRTNLREGCTIGPHCRVGGEVEESILHSYVNKYHDGFLGHSYVCPWVNLGALTTNSDLKNDYSEVSVPLGGVSRKSGSKKVGTFIGDHTKTAIGTLFNTGSAIGMMSLILPGGELLPKHVPSFSRVWHGQIEELPDGCESGVATAKIAMSRREQTLTPAMEQLIRRQFAATVAERQKALQRQRG